VHMSHDSKDAEDGIRCHAGKFKCPARSYCCR
jgi:hypothetical protein